MKILNQQTETEIYIGSNGHICISQDDCLDDKQVIAIHPILFKHFLKKLKEFEKEVL
jgi:exosome complex RNA-binding protein Rrp4